MIWRSVSRSHTTFCSCIEWLNMEPRPSMTAWATFLLPSESTIGQLLSLVSEVLGDYRTHSLCIMIERGLCNMGLVLFDTKYQYRACINHGFCGYDLGRKDASACTFHSSTACILAVMVPFGVSALMTRCGHLCMGISDEFGTTPMATIRGAKSGKLTLD
jgi:hypothetical protein